MLYGYRNMRVFDSLFFCCLEPEALDGFEFIEGFID